MSTIRTKLPVGDDCWGRVLTARPVTYMVDWSRELPDKDSAAQLAAAPVEPYRFHVVSRNTDKHLARFVPAFEGDSYRNLENLKGAYAGQTLVLVGAGPSAKGIGERLAPYRDRCKVMACNRGLNLVPDADFFYLIEALPKPEWWADTDTSKTKLICPIHAGEELLEWERDNTFYCWIKDVRFTDGELERLPLICGGHHVGTSALHVAHYLGFETVLLVGFDFAAFDVERDPQSRTVTGTFYGDGTKTGDSYIRGHNIWIATDISGADVMLTEHMVEHCRAMEVACEIAIDAGMRVVNCAGGGLLDFGSFGHLETLLAEPVLMAG